jgi:2-isopropylmalate synthase
LPHVIREVCLEVRKRFEGVLGIRAHNHSGLAVANTLEAVEQGFTHVEGSISAYGSCGGNADLCSIIANLEYKLGHTVVGRDNLEGMPGVAHFIVGAGRTPVRLKLVRNEEALLEEVDERLSGRLKSVERRAVLERIRLLESAGYELHTANGTLELLVREALSPERPFAAERYDLACHATPHQEAMTTATARLRVGDAVRSESEQGAGPVDALARALRQCLFALYPAITEIRLRDYRVHTIEPAHGGASRVRVAIDWSESVKRWTTVGVSADLVEAAWLALVGGFQLALMRVAERGLATLPSTADMSWAV